ncbi:MAG: SCO family protein [Sphingomonadaceae bacterium]
MNKMIVMAAAIALVGCQADVAPPLAGAAIGGPFTLMNEDGVRVTDAAFAGSYRLIYFGYTYCPDVCPVDVQKLMQGLTRFETKAPAAAARVQPLFITVDPERDTPAVLKTFTAAFHRRLIGLTGSPADIAATAKRFAVVYQKAPETSPGVYLVDHSRTAILFDPKGAPIALIPQDGTPDQIAGELARWVK